jgi:hypothetical protein
MEPIVLSAIYQSVGHAPSTMLPVFPVPTGYISLGLFVTQAAPQE